MQNNISMAGEYNLVVTRPDGTTAETGWFKNLILDQGLDRLGATNNNYSVATYTHCQIGTGTTAPDVIQTSLTSWHAGATNNNYGNASVVSAGAPTYASARTLAYVFAQGAVVGNMTEIGVGWAATGSTLFSRALISDGAGNPTAITITAIDQLTVYYKLTLTPVVTDGSGTVTLGGNTYNYVSRLANIGSWCNDGVMFNSSNYVTFAAAGSVGYPTNLYCSPASVTALGPITSLPASTSAFTTAHSSTAYTVGSYYKDFTINIPTSSANVAGGIGALVIQQSYGMYTQYVFTPAIPKDSTKTLSLTFRTSWSRGV